MVHKTDLLGYDMATMDEYFEYIITTHLNGISSQEVELISVLGTEQKKDFIDWCEARENDEDYFDPYTYCARLTLGMLK